MSVAHGISVVPVRLADAGALARLVSDNIGHLQPFMPKVASLDSLAATEQYLLYAEQARASGTILEWHIFSNERLCGAIRLNHIEPEHGKASVGYFLGEKFQGSGLATASVRAVLQYAFERLELNRIELRCASDNVASQRVAERLGFSWEGLLRQAEKIDGAYLDHFIYALLREDFMARAAEGMKQAA